MTIRSKLNKVGLISILTVAIVVGCVAAIPVAVHYSDKGDKYVAVAEIEKNADEVWLAVVQAAENREAESQGEMKILKTDSSARLLEATDGIQTASVEVKSVEQSKSKVIVTADVPDDKGKEIDKEKELAALIMKLLCEKAKANCQLVEQ